MDEASIFKRYHPNHYYGDVPVDEERCYIYHLQDFTNYVFATVNNHHNAYLRFKGFSLQDEKELGIIANESATFDFPKVSFQQAIKLYGFNVNLKKGKRYDCIINWSRVTRKKIQINNMEVKER